MMLTAAQLDQIERLLTSDRVTVHGNEAVAYVNLVTAVGQAKRFALAVEQREKTSSHAATNRVIPKENSACPPA